MNPPVHRNGKYNPVVRESRIGAAALLAAPANIHIQGVANEGALREGLIVLVASLEAAFSSRGGPGEADQHHLGPLSPKFG
jgi:hypothetical protein